MSIKISFITFTRNSGKRLKLLLENVKDVVDEIIVIDGFSSDDTVEIAKSYGAKVFRRKPWGHVEPDRMFALKKASYNWILYLDDDELLGKKLKNELRNLVTMAENMGYAALSTIRIDYDRKCKRLVFGPFYNKQIRIYRKDRLLYRGLVHELPVVFGKIHELPEEYYILHYPTWSRSKLAFYAYLEALEYYQHFSRSIIRKTLWKTLPFSAPLIILYNLINGFLKKQNPCMNLCTVMRTIDTAAFYELLVHILIKFRGKRRERLSKLISKYGLIRLLEPRYSD
jgi:glycosyltransferase involved in cell wall biosynthesis